MAYVIDTMLFHQYVGQLNFRLIKSLLKVVLDGIIIILNLIIVRVVADVPAHLTV